MPYPSSGYLPLIVAILKSISLSINEYCTDCPIRKECAVRPIFYSDKDYKLYRQQALMYSSIVAKK